VWRELYGGVTQDDDEDDGAFDWLPFLATSKDTAVAHAAAVLEAERLNLATAELPVRAKDLGPLEEMLWNDTDSGELLVGVVWV
jgi:hypothetical protein